MILLDPQAPLSAALPAPYQYLVLDIETANGRPEDAEREMRELWAPSAKWTPQTIGTRFLEATEKKLERLALIDSAPVVIVSLKSDTELRCLHCLREEAPRGMHGGLVEGFASPVGMLRALRTLLDARMSSDSPLVGHNILAFDLRKLRWAYLHHGLRLPMAFAAPDQSVFDTMRQYCSRFTMKGDVMVGLARVLEEFGIANHKTAMSGAEVPALVEAGEVDTLVQYALLDVLAEGELFLRMTGQADDRLVSQPLGAAA